MADRAEIIEEIEGLEAHCRAALMTVGTRHRWLSDWCDDLSKFPIEATRAAFRDWRQSGNTKFPTPGQIMPLVKAKVRRPDGDKPSGVRPWTPLGEGEYPDASIEDKLRHHRIMAERARFDAGPMYLAGATWASGRHLDAGEMPERWRTLRRKADNHASEAKALNERLRNLAEAQRGAA